MKVEGGGGSSGYISFSHRGMGCARRARAPKLQTVKAAKLVKLFFCCEVRLLLQGMQAKAHVSLCLCSQDSNKWRSV